MTAWRRCHPDECDMERRLDTVTRLHADDTGWQAFTAHDLTIHAECTAETLSLAIEAADEWAWAQGFRPTRSVEGT